MFLFLCEMGFHWDPRTQAPTPIVLSLSFKFIGGYLVVQLLTEGHDPTQPRLFYLFRIRLGKAQDLHPYLSNTGHSHRMCTDVSFSALHFLHEGVFALFILCSMYSRLIFHILQCILSSLLMNWTYLSIGPSRHSWLVPYLSQTLHSVCFLFSIITFCKLTSRLHNKTAGFLK